MKMFYLFILLQLLNVIISTIKSIALIKATPLKASFWNALYFSFYTYLVILTVQDNGITIHQKALITFCTNIIGITLVKYIQEIKNKNHFIKFEITIPINKTYLIEQQLTLINVPYSKIDIQQQPTKQQYYLYIIYCNNKQQKQFIANLITQNNIKYFTTKNEILL